MLAVLGDKELSDGVLHAFAAADKNSGDEAKEIVQELVSLLDPNDWRSVGANAEGVRYTPLTTHGHGRMGTRERLLTSRSAMGISGSASSPTRWPLKCFSTNKGAPSA